MKRLVEVFVDRYYGEYCAHMQELKILRPKGRSQCPLIDELDEIWYDGNLSDDQPCVKYERLVNNDERLTDKEEPPSSWTEYCKHFGGIHNTTINDQGAFIEVYKLCICCHPEQINKETINHE